MFSCNLFMSGRVKNNPIRLQVFHCINYHPLIEKPKMGDFTSHHHDGFNAYIDAINMYNNQILGYNDRHFYYIDKLPDDKKFDEIIEKTLVLSYKKFNKFYKENSTLSVDYIAKEFFSMAREQNNHKEGVTKLLNINSRFFK